MTEFCLVKGRIETKTTFNVVRSARRAIDSGETLWLSIDSPGGVWIPSQWAGSYVFDAKATAVVSYAASAAAFLALCCDRVVAKPDAEFAFHRVHWSPGFDGDDDELEHDNDFYAKAIQRKTQLPLNHCRSLMNQEWTINGEQAFELGIVDCLIG